MKHEELIKLLESEWTPEDGFFWEIREGRFDGAKAVRALEKISRLSIPEDATIPRRMVSLLWYIPVFMQWQVERVQEGTGDTVAYTKAITAFTNEIERLLGVP